MTQWPPLNTPLKLGKLPVMYHISHLKSKSENFFLLQKNDQAQFKQTRTLPCIDIRQLPDGD